MESLKQIIKSKLYPFEQERLQPFIDLFTAKYQNGLLAVVFYGSKLSPATDTPTSFYDFYLICENYKSFHAENSSQAFMNRFLPPNIYYEDLGDGRTCKACTISLDHLKREVRSDAQDFYHRGRFSKRFGIAWVKEPEVADSLVDVFVAATESLMPLALVLCGNRFAQVDFTKALLKLSYLGEVRPETDEKISQLYESEKEFYDRIHSQMLETFRRAHRKQLGWEPDENVYVQRRTISARLEERKRLEKALNRSKRRAKARWPKHIIQVDNWLDIILAKMERTQDVKIELTPRQQKHPLLFGWPVYFRLKRQGKFK